MGRIGIYGASFDPITNVHLWNASTIAHRKKLDKIIFLPSSSLRTDKKMCVADEHRLHMLELAIKNNPKLELDTYEFHVTEGKHYTFYTMEYFKEKYSGDDVFFIMGADLLVDMANGKWHRMEELIQRNQFIIMSRTGIDTLGIIAKTPLLRNYDDGRFHLLDKGFAMDISSSYIREEFTFGGDPRYLLPDECYFYIKKHGLYGGK